jgi:hypothetical protein
MNGDPTSFVCALYAAPSGLSPSNNKWNVARHKWRRLVYQNVESELIRRNVFDVLLFALPKKISGPQSKGRHRCRKNERLLRQAGMELYF